MRRLAAVTTVAVALASVALGAPRTWEALREAREAYAPLDDEAAERAAGRHHHLDPRVWDFFGAHVGEGDRWFIRFPRGESEQLRYERTVVGAYAAFWLLPAVRVAEPDAADVVVYYRVRAADASCLGERPFCVARRP